MTPTAAVRSILGDPSGTLSEARFREVVVAVLRAVREPSERMVEMGHAFDPLGCDVPEEDVAMIYGRIYRAMIDALIEEATAL